jgi:hypothetical protein
MGWLEDLLKEVPLSAVLKERIQLAEDKFAHAAKENELLRQQISALEKENGELRAKTPQRTGPSLSNDTKQVLIHLFRATELDDRDVGAMSHALDVELGLLKYHHLDRLDEAKLAKVGSGNYVTEQIFWMLTPAGRQYVVENNLN